MKNTFPFAAVCGQQKVKKALLLSAVNPQIVGVLISGEKGTAKSTLVRGFADILEDRTVIDLPLDITEDRLVGGIDIGKAVRYGKKELEEGLLKKAHGHFLYVDEVNLLSRHIANILLEVASTGVNVIEREGISYSHPSRFVLVGSMNPEEGLLRSQFMDRFGLYAEAKGEADLAVRIEIMKRRLEYEKDPIEFCHKWKEAGKKLAADVSRARKLLEHVTVVEEDYKLAAAISQEGHCAGHRAEILLIETARANAALDKREHISVEDIREAAAFVLPHRLREAAVLEEVLEKSNERNPKKQVPEPDRATDGQPEKVEDGEGSQELVGSDPGEGSNTGADASENPDVVEDIEQYEGELSVTLAAESKAAEMGTGKRNKVKTGSRQGRYVGYRLPKDGVKDIAFDATFRLAACRQAGRDRGELAICIHEEDLREKIREKYTGATLLFVVDASGSMGARRRMGAVKGAVLSLLQTAYQKRDSIGIIAFRKDHAETLLNITRSADLAQKCLAALPTGGRTPLAAGLYKAYELLKIDRIKNPDALQYMILVSDGRANVPLKGGNALEDAAAIGEKIRNEGIRSLVLDTESGYIQMGFAGELAKKMQGQYMKINNISKTEIENTVKRLIKTV